jgi:hypothetical protein
MIGWMPCREPALEDLLADEIMQKVIASARIDAATLRRQLGEIATRIGDRIPSPSLRTAPAA